MIILALTYEELELHLGELKTFIEEVELDTSMARILINLEDKDYFDIMERLYYESLLDPTTYTLNKEAKGSYVFNHDFMKNILKSHNACIITTPTSLKEKFHFDTVTEFIRYDVMVHHLDGEPLGLERLHYLKGELSYCCKPIKRGGLQNV